MNNVYDSSFAGTTRYRPSGGTHQGEQASVRSHLLPMAGPTCVDPVANRSFLQTWETLQYTCSRQNAKAIQVSSILVAK